MGQVGCAGDWHGAGFSPTERTEGRFARYGRHRRLAKAGSPATERGCGELWRALLAAAVAVAATRLDFDKVLSFTRAEIV